MRPKLDNSTNRMIGIPKRYWGAYLDEIEPLNDEQKSCIQKMLDLERGKYWALVVLGTVGNGKTTLACSLASLHEYYHSFSSLYITQEDLLDKCRNAMNDRSEANVLERYMRCGLLIIDELSKATWTEYAKTTMQKIFRYRHAEKLRTVAIGNLDVSTFKGMFDDHILSRFREGETQIMKADDMRLHGEF